MSTKGKVAGKLFSRRHTTLGSKLAKDICSHAAKFPQIKKISPGIIRIGLRTKAPRVKLTTMQGGILVSVISHATAQHIRIYTDEPIKPTIEKLVAAFEKTLSNCTIINQS